jgi:hypothetical protein
VPQREILSVMGVKVSITSKDMVAHHPFSNIADTRFDDQSSLLTDLGEEPAVTDRYHLEDAFVGEAQKTGFSRSG